MKSKILLALMAGSLGVIAALVIPAAWAGDEKFSLTGGFDSNSNQYQTGPWVFKLAAPAGLSGGVAPEMGRNSATTGSALSGLSDTEAAASYNIYAGSGSTPQINLTGKVKVRQADKTQLFSFRQNDYAAQMDVYQSLNKFTAKGSLGSKVLRGSTGITLNPLLYGSFGGIYQLTEKTSTGIDMRLSQDPSATQQELSAYVSYKLDNSFKARGYVLRGFSNGSPNNAIGGQVYYGF
jgi:hypothetical protein